MKEGALIAMMAAWSPRVVKAIGHRTLNRLLRRIRNEVFDTDEYILFRDTIAFATDDGSLLGNTKLHL